MTESFSLRNKRIWVAGHNGLVGAATVRRLQQEPCDILTTPRAALDLRRQEDVERWLDINKPDAVILAAATVGGIVANRDYPADFLYDNLTIETNIIHAAYKTGVEKLLFLGSSCIYPREATQPIDENALLTGPLEPTNECYAIAKIAGIKLCQAYRRQHGCNFIAVLPCNLYGPGDTYDAARSHVIPALIMKIQAAKQQRADHISLWGTGRPLREFLYGDDLADALVFLLEQYAEEQHINVGSGKEISIAALAALIAGIVGYKGEIRFDPSRPDGTPRKVMKNDRINAMGWQPQTSLREGLKKSCDEYRESIEKKRRAA